MFTYPLPSAGGWPTEEYVLIAGYSVNSITNGLVYASVGPGGFSIIASKQVPGLYTNWVTSDGTYVIHRGETDQVKGARFCGWDGGTGFTASSEATSSENIYTTGLIHNSNYPDLLLSPGSSSFERNTAIHTYDPTTPTMTLVQSPAHPSNTRNAAEIADFRSAQTYEYGEMLAWPYYNGSGVFLVRDLSQDGTTATLEGYTAGIIGAATQHGGWDRDYYRLFRHLSGITMSTVDFDTPGFTAPVTLTGHDLTNVYASTGHAGMLILFGQKADGSKWLQSYTISGTTLTKAGEYDFGSVAADSTNSQLLTSPRTGYVYNLAGSSAHAGVFKVAEGDGSITRIDTIPYSNSSGAMRNNFHFLGASPLPNLS